MVSDTSTGGEGSAAFRVKVFVGLAGEPAVFGAFDTGQFIRSNRACLHETIFDLSDMFRQRKPTHNISHDSVTEN
jgi:hypothetical protein